MFGHLQFEIGIALVWPDGLNRIAKAGWKRERQTSSRSRLAPRLAGRLHQPRTLIGPPPLPFFVKVSVVADELRAGQC